LADASSQIMAIALVEKGMFSSLNNIAISLFI